MALVHEELYRAPDLSQVDMRDYVSKLVGRLVSLSPARVSVSFDLEPVRLLPDEAIPCGLLIDELVMNALKHSLRRPRRREARDIDEGKLGDRRARGRGRRPRHRPRHPRWPSGRPRPIHNQESRRSAAWRAIDRDRTWSQIQTPLPFGADWGMTW